MKRVINYKGIDFDVEFDYQPHEKADVGPEAKYPGCPEAIGEINEIKHKGICFLEFLENDIDDIKTSILECLIKERR